MDVIEHTNPATHAKALPIPGAITTVTPPIQPRQCLTFRLGAEEYAIDILRVQEIRGYEQPTRLANAPAYVKGVLNLRGVIVPVVDLRSRFGQEQPSFDPLTVTVVLNVGGRTVGAVVDAVSDVIELSGDQVRPAPEFNATIDSSYITGIATLRQEDRQRMLILIDIQQLVMSPELGLFNPALQ